MNKYSFSCPTTYNHFLEIHLEFEARNQDEVFVQLPSWRPGRYELANFAKNIQKFNVFNENEEPLNFKKVSKDRWVIQTQKCSKLSIYYNYYANTLDAGSTYVDDYQCYINPVNCCLIIEGQENQKHQVKLSLPDDYKIATGLKQTQDKHVLYADSYDELAECPIIASPKLKHYSYEVDGIHFHLWLQGPHELNNEKLLPDFKKFSEEQIKCFGKFPTDEYHFMFQLTPYKSYHGVEHTNSTMILIGDEKNVFESRYDQILGICSHELYHTWNIKAIRPLEMLPYDYSQENYSRLGFVAEGVTTYMGDLILKRSGVFNWEQFLKTQNENLKRHFENDGRHNMSLSDSAFDTWLDGYSLGIPNRKVSIYTEGALNMLMIDLTIIKNTDGQKTLSDVMRTLYEKHRYSGYDEDDFQQLCIELGGLEVNQIFENHIYNNEDYTHSLQDALSTVGISLNSINNPDICARRFGFFSIKTASGNHVIKKIQNNSQADKLKIAVEDEITAINNKPIKDLNFQNEVKNSCQELTLTIKTRFNTREATFKLDEDHYPLYELELLENPTQKQQILRKVWAN